MLFQTVIQPTGVFKTENVPGAWRGGLSDMKVAIQNPDVYTKKIFFQRAEMNKTRTRAIHFNNNENRIETNIISKQKPNNNVGIR